MKKAGILLCGALAGVMFVGLGGCGQTPTACNILIEDAKTSFAIGDNFSLAEEMELKLLFTNEKTLSLGDMNSLQHDKANKKYISSNFSIDYSNFDSTKGGECAIFVNYYDTDRENNNLRVYYTVHVQWDYNDWIKMPQLTQEWTWGETPTFTPGQVDFLNDSAEYFYKLKNGAGYSKINNPQTIENELKALDAGEYYLKVVYPKTDTITGLETVISFKINRLALPATVVPELQSQVYTGKTILPDVPESQYYFFAYNNITDFTNVGTHYVTLTLTDPNFKWADTDLLSKNIEFEITPATNQWKTTTFDVQSVGIEKGWVKGSFDEEQFVAPEAQFGKVLFKYKAKNADDATYSNIAIDQLQFLSVGEYTLKAYIPESNNYSSLEPITINFVVAEQE